MAESSTTTRRFSSRTSLAALGVKLRSLDVFGPIRGTVRIAQKAVKHTPAQKLYDAFIAMLAGAHGLVELNTRVRSDRALQVAFGRTACAEQSVVQETLDACTAENVAQLEQAVDAIYRQHSQGYRHDYGRGWQVLDADMSGVSEARTEGTGRRGTGRSRWCYGRPATADRRRGHPTCLPSPSIVPRRPPWYAPSAHQRVGAGEPSAA